VCQDLQVLEEACLLAQELGLLERDGRCLRVPVPQTDEFNWDDLLDLEEHQASIAEGSEEGTLCEDSWQLCLSNCALSVCEDGMSTFCNMAVMGIVTCLIQSTV
jgi:hypothetical protein